jgi:hypothetical protein
MSISLYLTSGALIYKIVLYTAAFKKIVVYIRYPNGFDPARLEIK